MSGTRVLGALRPPIDLTLAAANETIPAPTSMRGGTWYEPEWDEYRLAIVRDAEDTALWSRHGKNLTGRFPDVAAAAARHVPPGTVLDGEVVAWVGDRLGFSALQRRMAGSAASVARAAHRWPASYVAFDVLAVDGDDTRSLPYTERRSLLLDLAAGWSPPMNVTPATDDVAVARGWFTELAVTGVEGLVVKAGGAPYRVKVKHRDSLNVVCAAVLGPVTAPQAVVAGLLAAGRLRIVGRTVPLTRAAAALAHELVPARGGHPWPVTVTSTTVHGFGRARDPVELTLVEPVVVEVSADVAWSGTAFRHPLRFVRTRPDTDPADVLAPGAPEVSP